MADDEEVDTRIDVDELTVVTVRVLGRPVLIDLPEALVLRRRIGRAVQSRGFSDEV